MLFVTSKVLICNIYSLGKHIASPDHSIIFMAVYIPSSMFCPTTRWVQCHDLRPEVWLTDSLPWTWTPRLSSLVDQKEGSSSAQGMPRSSSKRKAGVTPGVETQSKVRAKP